MRIPDPPVDPTRIARFVEAGYWTETTSNDALEQQARDTPDKLAIIDGRVRLGYGEYYRRAERLAAYVVTLGLGPDDVIVIQLPNWSEFAVAVNAAMLAGVPFCQFHSDFHSREVEFILNFTGASALIMPSRFRRFDHLAMLADLRPKLPQLRHVMVVGGELPPVYALGCSIMGTTLSWCTRSGCFNGFPCRLPPPLPPEAHMRTIPILAALTALAVLSAQAAPNPNPENWRPLTPAMSFGLGDQACGDGWHQALWRDWRGDWWWGPCVRNR